MTTTAYYCPLCGWRCDVAANADVPYCRDCDGSMLPLDGGAVVVKRSRRRTAIAGTRPGEVKPRDERANPFYRRGEG